MKDKCTKCGKGKDDHWQRGKTGKTRVLCAPANLIKAAHKFLERMAKKKRSGDE